MAGIDPNTVRLTQIASMAYGSGRSEGAKGGRGYMGVLFKGHTVEVVKYDTRLFGGSSANAKDANQLFAANALRAELLRIAAGKEGLSQEQMREIRAALGLKPGEKDAFAKSLLSRTAVARAVSLIDKDVWKKAQADSVASRGDTRFSKVADGKAAIPEKPGDSPDLGAWPNAADPGKTIGDLGFPSVPGVASLQRQLHETVEDHSRSQMAVPTDRFGRYTDSQIKQFCGAIDTAINRLGAKYPIDEIRAVVIAGFGLRASAQHVIQKSGSDVKAKLATLEETLARREFRELERFAEAVFSSERVPLKAKLDLVVARLKLMLPYPDDFEEPKGASPKAVPQGMKIFGARGNGFRKDLEAFFHEVAERSPNAPDEQYQKVVEKLLQVANANDRDEWDTRREEAHYQVLQFRNPDLEIGDAADVRQKEFLETNAQE